jgi:dynein heavy chain 2, cytosolic
VLAERVVGLMGTDLVRSKEKWVQGVREMRDLFQHLETQGFSGESQQVWRQHWDYQLYKALHHQYSLGLEAINKTLPEVRALPPFHPSLHIACWLRT